MTTKTRTDLDKLYTLDHYDTDNGLFRIHHLDLVSSYDGTYVTSYNKARVKFQSSLKSDNPDGTICNNGLPYAGRFIIDLEYFENVAPVITKALKKAHDVAPNVTNQLEKLIVGLRALGYKQTRHTDHKIWSID